VREAREEIGIDIDPRHLSIVHVMHRKTDRHNIDIFMSCDSWGKEIVNEEPEKCGGLRFFNPADLPENTIDFIVEALDHITNKATYSERGWGLERPLEQSLSAA
jgi:8-oxo-dGTP pyrophosphatase MutT (NUDIX family)